MERSCFWYGTIQEFIDTAGSTILLKLKQQHRIICNQFSSSSQNDAWKNCLTVLKPLAKKIPAKFHIIFEYVLPRERGRRPDVLIISHKNAYIFEFKDTKQIGKAYIDQVDAYARDLAEYHSSSRTKNVFPILIMTQHNKLRNIEHGVHIYSPDTLYEDIEQLLEINDKETDIYDFITGEYAPLPSLVEAAKLLFERAALPQIRRAASAGIPATLETLRSCADEHIAAKGKVLALVTGVPGAGKTLVGLQTAYDYSHAGKRQAVYLSGNGPLVQVLQHALGKGSKAFVQDVHAFLKDYGGDSTRIPEEKIWIYDEAQRAWDIERAQEKRGVDALSEPMDFVKLASRIHGGTMIIGLIGEGQEIHLGEEAGIGQWNEAIAQSSDEWTVLCPAHVAHVFTAASLCNVEDTLNLNTSLRTHRASLVQNWVSSLISSDLPLAAKWANIIKNDQYKIYITRNFDSAKKYVKIRYEGVFEKRFGLLASSKATNLEQWGIHNSFQATRRIKFGPWYDDVPESPLSCCQLDIVTTEFGCQGLELDFPIVCWGNDLTWVYNRWKSSSSKRSQAKDPHQLRLNSYRVLLTRGRDGLIIFVPNDSTMNDTYDVLLQAGCTAIDRISTL